MVSWTTIVRENIRCISEEGCCCCCCNPERLQESSIVSAVYSASSDPSRPSPPPLTIPRQRWSWQSRDKTRLLAFSATFRANSRAHTRFTLHPKARKRESAPVKICIKSDTASFFSSEKSYGRARATLCKSGARKYERFAWYNISSVAKRIVSTDISFGAIFPEVRFTCDWNVRVRYVAVSRIKALALGDIEKVFIFLSVSKIFPALWVEYCY